MYGMVNNAVREHALAVWGPEAWAAVAEKAGVDPDGFTTMTQYDDAVTVAMVVAAAEALDLPPAEVLRQIGRAWIDYAGKSAFAGLMRMAGDDVASVLRNLEDMHHKVKLSMPHLEMPHFEVEDLPDGTVRVRYQSTREGLFPFVEGLLEGLSARFEQPLELLSHSAVGPAEAVWTVRLGARGAAAAA